MDINGNEEENVLLHVFKLSKDHLNGFFKMRKRKQTGLKTLKFTYKI